MADQHLSSSISPCRATCQSAHARCVFLTDLEKSLFCQTRSLQFATSGVLSETFTKGCILSSILHLKAIKSFYFIIQKNCSNCQKLMKHFILAVWVSSDLPNFFQIHINIRFLVWNDVSLNSAHLWKVEEVPLKSLFGRGTFLDHPPFYSSGNTHCRRSHKFSCTFGFLHKVM